MKQSFVFCLLFCRMASSRSKKHSSAGLSSEVYDAIMQHEAPSATPPALLPPPPPPPSFPPMLQLTTPAPVHKIRHHGRRKQRLGTGAGAGADSAGGGGDFTTAQPDYDFWPELSVGVDDIVVTPNKVDAGVNNNTTYDRFPGAMLIVETEQNETLRDFLKICSPIDLIELDGVGELNLFFDLNKRSSAEFSSYIMLLNLQK